MLSFIIRLDDACPTMLHENWRRMETLLDKYGVKPIVGVIPDCRDDAEDFRNEEDKDFTSRVIAWKNKGWTIAQHGLHHVFTERPKSVKCFQKCREDITELAGIPYEKQKEMIEKGYMLLKDAGIEPDCFFAPAHTFDENTVQALRDIGKYSFVSDGYALRPYRKNGMTFLPSIFDAPHKILPFGTYTFIYHPSKIGDAEFEELEAFLKYNKENVKSAAEVLASYKKLRGQGITGRLIERAMYIVRGIRDHGKN